MIGKKRGFTLIELLVVISIIALLIGILLPALGAARRTANQMKNSTQLRGIHSGLVVFAQGNGEWYPDFNASGQLANDDNWQITDVYEILIGDNLFAPELAVSPGDAVATVWDPTGGADDFDQTTNNSYAWHAPVANDDNANLQANRSLEWRATSNSQAAVLADRAIDNDTSGTLRTAGDGDAIRSIWTAPDDDVADWRGSIAFNDNHVVFESGQQLDTTRYGQQNIADDALFSDDTFNGTGDDAGDNAFLVYEHTSDSGSMGAVTGE